MSAASMRRTVRRAQGASYVQIAREEGIVASGARESVHRVVRKASRLAQPGSTLPVGLQWRKRSDESWYVSYVGVSPEAALWALDILRPQSPSTSTFAKVIKRTGWRVEVLWNSRAGWFTARLISPWDRDGNATYPGGFLAPFDNPLGASGVSPEEALVNLAGAVLEWA